MFYKSFNLTKTKVEPPIIIPNKEMVILIPLQVLKKCVTDEKRDKTQESGKGWPLQPSEVSGGQRFGEVPERSKCHKHDNNN